MDQIKSHNPDKSGQIRTDPKHWLVGVKAGTGLIFSLRFNKVLCIKLEPCPSIYYHSFQKFGLGLYIELFSGFCTHCFLLACQKALVLMLNQDRLALGNQLVYNEPTLSPGFLAQTFVLSSSSQDVSGEVSECFQLKFWIVRFFSFLNCRTR